MSKHTKESILALLDNPANYGNRIVERALLAIYERQTAQEQSIGDTVVNNGIGFSGAHAKKASYMVGYIKSRGRLTGKWFDDGLHIAKRYAGQLAKIANGEI